MNLVTEVPERLGQIVDVDSLPAAVHVTPVGQEANLHSVCHPAVLSSSSVYLSGAFQKHNRDLQIFNTLASLKPMTSGKHRIRSRGILDGRLSAAVTRTKIISRSINVVLKPGYVAGSRCSGIEQLRRLDVWPSKFVAEDGASTCTGHGCVNYRAIPVFEQKMPHLQVEHYVEDAPEPVVTVEEVT